MPMTSKLGWESVEAMVAEHRRSLEPDVEPRDADQEAARVIAAVWEWALSREAESPTAN